MGHEDRLRAHLLDLLGGGHAHPNFDQVAAGRRTGPGVPTSDEAGVKMAMR